MSQPSAGNRASQLSRSLTWAARHSTKCTTDSEGWIPVSQIREAHFQNNPRLFADSAKPSMIREAIEVSGNRLRHKEINGESHIQACQGHTVKGRVFLATENVDFGRIRAVYHYTSWYNGIDVMKAKALKRMDRTHVHFKTTSPLRQKTKLKEAMCFEVDTRLRDRYEFILSDSGSMLVEVDSIPLDDIAAVWLRDDNEWTRYSQANVVQWASLLKQLGLQAFRPTSLPVPEIDCTVDFPVLEVERLSEHATLPTRGSEQAAGADLTSAHKYVVPANGKAIVMTDLAIRLPPGCYGRIAPRSGLAAKHFIDVGAGVIDADYRGNLGVILFNFGIEDFVVNRGDRIAQLICERITIPQILEASKPLDSTARGAAGFGSTGVSDSRDSQA